MVTTDCEIFNTVMDKMLDPEDRRLMLVKAKGATHAEGLICFDPEAIAMMKQTRESCKNRLDAIDKMIMLSELGVQLRESCKNRLDAIDKMIMLSELGVQLGVKNVMEVANP